MDQNHDKRVTELASPPNDGADVARDLTNPQKAIIATVVAGAVAIAAIGFVGSYNAVVSLAIKKGFGTFANVFPLGVDVGITTLLALDLVLTWFRMPFPFLRHAAWALTGATIGFNVAASWDDWIAVGMHATMPALFVLVVEAGRHAVSRMAKINSGAYYENPPLPRWILSPYPTYRIWRRMRMWNLRSYVEVIVMEQDTKVFRQALRFRHGRGWKKQALPAERLALDLAKLGKPIRQTLQDYVDGAFDSATLAPREGIQGRPESAPATNSMAPCPAIESATEAPQNAIAGRPQSVPGTATEAPRPTVQGATHGATVDLTKRPKSATAAAIMAPPGSSEGATQSATAAATEAPPNRPADRPRSATKAPRPTATGRPGQAPRDAARDAIRALYTDLGRRPLESEMVAVLKTSKLPKSRQFANARRLEIEKADPTLAALGSDNVRPLTGTDS